MEVEVEAKVESTHRQIHGPAGFPPPAHAVSRHLHLGLNLNDRPGREGRAAVDLCRPARPFAFSPARRIVGA